MDDLYTIPVTSDPKFGLGLLASDLETFQFPTLCEELSHEQLLALEDNQNFYLAFPDAGVFGTCDEVVSRTSTAVTPQSECSTRTTLSTTNISPTSDILSFHDRFNSQDVEAMYHDTTQSVISGRQSRAASTTWPAANGNLISVSSNLTPPTRPAPHRPQSFSYRPQPIAQLDNQTPPPPSSFFPSPSMQPQTISSRSPFLTPSMQSPLVPQMAQLPAQNAFLPTTLTANPSSYYGQPQSQLSSASQQQLQQQYQQQLQFQQQQNLLHRRSLPSQALNHTQMTALFPQHQVPSQTQSMQSYNINAANNSTLSAPSSSNVNAPSLPNTTGNSSTGYQCFSHGCGGRHFSNWGNLVRHHRERQLRSKAGAKPTCPRCGKGFTRSSARDAHVAGLKCVLGRRRRGATNATGAASGATNNGSSKGEQSSGMEDHGDDNGRPGRRGHTPMKDGEMDNEHDDGNDNGSEGSREDADIRDGDDDDEVEMLGGRNISYGGGEDALVSAMRLGGPAYLAPQQLQFQH